MNDPDEKLAKMRLAVNSVLADLEANGRESNFDLPWSEIDTFPDEIVQGVKAIYRKELEPCWGEYERINDLYKLPHRPWEKMVAEQDEVGLKVRALLKAMYRQMTMLNVMCNEQSATLSDLMTEEANIRISLQEIRAVIDSK